VITVEVDWKTRLLATITDPSVALILMMIGIYGLFFEFFNPGMILPGVAGAICLLIALFAFQLLPINYAGLALMALGIAFMLGEAFLPSFGVLGIGGAVAFGFGAVMLIDTDLPGYGIPLSLIAGLAITSALFTFFIVGMAVQARRQPVVSGQQQLQGSIGVVMEAFDQEGWVHIHGERWRAQSPVPVTKGQRVRVEGRAGLTLNVVPLDELKGE
jgi:membrane-bound serine protease (ClpP class)